MEKSDKCVHCYFGQVFFKHLEMITVNGNEIIAPTVYQLLS